MTTIYTDRPGGGSGGWAGHPEQCSHGRMSHTLVSDSSAQPRNGVSPAVWHSHSWLVHGLQGPGAHPSYRHSFGEAEPNPKHTEGNTPAKTSEVQLPPWVCWQLHCWWGVWAFPGPIDDQDDKVQSPPGSPGCCFHQKEIPHSVTVCPPALPPARTNHPWVCWGGNLSCVPYPHTELSWGFHRLTESLRKGL